MACKICFDHYGSDACLAPGEQGHSPAESTEPSDTNAALEPTSDEQPAAADPANADADVENIASE